MEFHDLKDIMEEWLEILPRDDIIPRIQRPELTTRRANAIYGLRRSGKTYLSFQLVATPNTMVYINLEDERIPRNTSTLASLIPAASSILGEDKFWLIVDEIQSVPQWERWVNRVVERREVNLIVTGSSHRLSRSNLPKVARGRVRSFRLFPLSFQEFLRFKQFEVSRSQVGRGRTLAMLQEYMRFGGMPSVVLERSKAEKTREARDLLDVIILRDIIDQFQVKSSVAIRDMLTIIANSKLVSINQMYKNLVGVGHKVGKSTVAQYLTYPEFVFFYEPVMIYGESVKSEIQHPRKVYLADNIFYSILSTRLHNSWLFENLVFWEIKRRFPDMEVRYWNSKEGYEVDFVLLKNHRVRYLIQVAYSTEDRKTRTREERSLVKASRELGCKELLILTWDEEQENESDGRKIAYVPVWKWLLHDREFPRSI